MSCMQFQKLNSVFLFCVCVSCRVWVHILWRGHMLTVMGLGNIHQYPFKLYALKSRLHREINIKALQLFNPDLWRFARWRRRVSRSRSIETVTVNNVKNVKLKRYYFNEGNQRLNKWLVFSCSRASNTPHGALLGTFRFVGLYKKVLYTTV